MNEDSLRFGTRFARCASDLHCQVGKWMKPCVVSMTTLLSLIKWNSKMGHVRFFITTKCSAEVWCPISNSSVAIANGFSNWPFATWV